MLTQLMRRGSRNDMKQRSNQPLRKKIMDSEDSDEDYVVEVEEVDEQSDDLVSLVGDASAEESFFEELKEEKEEDDVEDGREGGWRSVVKSKPRAQKGISRSRKNGVNRPKKRRNVISSDDSDDSDDDDFEYLEDEKDDDDEDGREGGVKTVVKTKPRDMSNRLSRSRKNGVNRPKKRRKIIGDDDDDSDDDEFSPDEFDYLEAEEEDEDEDEDEELEEEDEDEFLEAMSKTRKRAKTTLKRRNSVRKRRSKTVRKPSKSKTKSTKNSASKANSSGEEEFLEKGPSLRGRAKGTPGRRKKRMAARSDSDICSDPSDREFTISEEEREQVREANLLCRNAITNLRSSRKNPEDEPFCVPKKQPARKGKEKAVETKNDMGKPVCGICLTEEGKSSLRGTLNCCSHYFCFACIMEWSKVETRCPLCKQRFVTISKPTKCGKGFDLRNAVVTVPERDQVYQPSEEELRDFLNPYENVICTECNHGGDDALMLLCDVCDSPAHTYCVGLGHEVPEGNWYCDGCRPAALASSHSQFQNFEDNQISGAGASGGHSTYENMSEIDLNVTIPETPLSQGDRLLSPRFSGGSLQLPSPVSGIGVSTVSGRRRIHHQIRYILSNRMSQGGGVISSIGNILGVGVNAPFHQSRTEEGTSHHGQQFDRFHDSYHQNVQNTNFDLGSLGNMTSHVGQPVIAVDDLFHGHRAWDRLENIPFEPTQAQSSASGPLQPCSRSSIGPAAGGLSSENRKEECTNFARQEAHSIVRNQLRSLPREMNLDHESRLAVALDGSFHGHRAWNGLDSILSDSTQVHLAATGPLQPCTSRSSIRPDNSGFSSENRRGERTNFVRQEVHSIVINQLRSLPRNMNLGQSIFMDISRRSEHTIMSAFGLEPPRHDIMQPPSCTHLLGRLANVESCPLSGYCLICFRNFVTVTVRRIITEVMMAPHWQDFGH